MKARIGELASMLSCNDTTIRYYEKKGLLPKPVRTAANYRLYDEQDLDRLRFILNCRKHGITLAEIKSLLSFRADPRQECNVAHKIVDKHLKAIDRQIKSLTDLKTDLENLGKAGACDQKGTCIVLEHFATADACDCCAKGAEQKQSS